MCKIVFVGQSAVGKTSLIIQITRNTFYGDSVSATLTAAVSQFEPLYNNKKLNLTIWDTAGQERFESLTPVYFKNSSFVVMVFDFTNLESFKKLESYLEMASARAPTAHLFLLGNKCDLHKPEVSQQQIDEWCSRVNATFFGVSAKTSEGIPEFVREISRLASEKETGETMLQINDQKQENGKKCC